MKDNEKPSNPRMHNPDGVYASEARNEDYFSLRDYFAAMTLEGINSDIQIVRAMSQDRRNLTRDKQNDTIHDYIAQECYKQADAMLKERIR